MTRQTPITEGKTLHAKALVTVGFILLLLFMLATSLLSMNKMTALKQKMERITEFHSQKKEILNRMYYVISERSMSMYRLRILTDPFDIDDEYIHYRSLASEFVQAREEFEALPLNQDEEATFNRVLELIRMAQPVQEKLVERIIDGQASNANELILTENAPLESSILMLLEGISESQDQFINRILESAKFEYSEARISMFILNCIIMFAGISIALIVVRRTDRIEQDLLTEKELAQITLYAIGDAVVTTDTQLNLRFLNHAAQQLLAQSISKQQTSKIDHLFYLSDDNGNPLQFNHFIPHDREAIVLPGNTQLKNQRNDTFFIEGSVSPLFNHSQKLLGYIFVFRDITESLGLTRKLSWQASHDALTGLRNRREFESLLQNLVNSAQKESLHHCLLYIDLDQFKIVNDTCGHIAGDELLKQLSALISQDIRASDSLARLGGDEFGLLLEGCPASMASQIAENLLRTIQNFRFIWKNRTFKIGASIGVVEINSASRSMSSVLAAADSACYIAKDKGRNRVWLHALNDNEVSQRHGEMELVATLNDALESNHFVIYKQKIVLTDGSNKATNKQFYELLIRLKTNSELLPPMAFIPAAERYGIMPSIDRWMIKHVIQRIQEHPECIAEVDMVTINLSGLSVGEDKFLDFVIDELDRSGIDAEQICFEITETAAIANWLRARRFISVLKGIGCHFALDDFGSGMSSFSYLQRLPIDFVKIDGSFVRDIAANEINYAMVEAIHKVAKVMGLKTIAEFVEDSAARKHLQTIGVDYIQGFSVSKPEPF
ncbi:MAG: EAL domain-containing protein [Gammaproteobacteria bacterium]|nr:EAL domain-containing protein [Gammaproteobacteria bacterium]MDH5730559.1 EAL domain-containing protein [Gammaproteobacteria bacterium]